MFMESFWCADPPVLIPGIKWSRYPDVSLHYVCEGAWSWLNFHVVFKTSFIVTRALFRVLCLGVSVSLLSLSVKLGNCLAASCTSCKYRCGSWMCVTGAIRHTRC